VLDSLWEPFKNEIRTLIDWNQTALKERGIDQMLSEARADHKESDEVHMRRKCES
jgi:hypothetical protein